MSFTAKQRGALVLSPYFSPNVGGQETHLTDLCDALAEAGVDVYVLAYRPLTTPVVSYLPFEVRGNITIRRLPWPSGPWVYQVMNHMVWRYFLYLTPGLFVLTLWFLLVYGRRVSVIHAHGLVAAFIARVLGRWFGKRTLMSIHSVYSFAERPDLARKVGLILRGLDGVIPLAASSEADLLATGIPRERFFPMTQWVRLDRFAPNVAPAVEWVEVPSSALKVLCVGRLYEGKGIHLVAEALATLDGAAYLLVVGEGPMEERIRKAGGGQDRIRLLGRRGQDALPGLFAGADLVVVPSTIEEGFSRVVMEALASGCPVMVSNRGCLPEMIQEGTGFLVEPTVASLQEALVRCVCQRDALRAMRPACRAAAEQRFSSRNVGDVLRAYFPDDDEVGQNVMP